MGSPEAKAAAYGELGQLHATLGNLEQAVSCLEHQKNIARDLSKCGVIRKRQSSVYKLLFVYPDDRIMESEALCALGNVYHQMGEYTTALKYHQSDLEIAEQLDMPNLQSRACGNIG